MEEKEKSEYDVYFIADLHLRHRNILKHQPNRVHAMGLKNEEDIDGHDQYIIDAWLDTVKRNDHVYVLGDMILSSKQDSLKILHNLKSKGCHIHLIVGNHDKSTQNMKNMFNSIDLIKVVDFKKSVFPFLDEDFCCVMCHYPLLSWPRKAHGSIMLHGHTHNNSPHENEGNDLRLNVGMDTPFANYQLISLEKIYTWYKGKLNGENPKDYIEKITKEDPKFIR